ncbi:MAG: DUF6624 domain-containing protein [Rubricoccaceae bacterium]|nr:DUF6624 domain-containing protein [Rubricoccaceae bacterium]
MRRVVRVFAILLLVSACSGRGIDQELRIELLEMARADQDLRGMGMALMQRLPETQAEFMLFIEEQNELNVTHFSRLEEVIAAHGWPGRSLVGVEGTEAALTILSHATVDQQKTLLPMLREAVAAGEMTASQLARREDSILINDGESQIYGTFFVSDADGNPVLAPVRDPANLEKRRRSVGLPSMEEQFQQLEQELGMPVGRGNLATDGD